MPLAAVTVDWPRAGRRLTAVAVRSDWPQAGRCWPRAGPCGCPGVAVRGGAKRRLARTGRGRPRADSGQPRWPRWPRDGRGCIKKRAHSGDSQSRGARGRGEDGRLWLTMGGRRRWRWSQGGGSGAQPGGAAIGEEEWRRKEKKRGHG